MQKTKERKAMKSKARKAKKLITKSCEFCQKVFVGKTKACSTSCTNCLSLHKEF